MITRELVAVGYNILERIPVTKNVINRERHQLPLPLLLLLRVVLAVITTQAVWSPLMSVMISRYCGRQE